MNKRVKILWIVFLLQIALSLIFNAFFKKFAISPTKIWIVLSLPIILLILHSIWTLGIKRSLTFILLTSLIGSTFEKLALNGVNIFGGPYVYNPVWPTFFQVPIMVIAYWAVFIYTAYCITNSFLFWADHNKPSKNQKNFLSLLPLIILDGVLVVIIDLFLDPIQVKIGSWTWLEGGAYFDVPIGNFLGWFFITIFPTGIFRIFEYFKPRKIRKALLSTFLIPVLGYGLMGISYTFSALLLEMKNLAVIGFSLMLPIVIINLYLFKKSKIPTTNKHTSSSKL